MVHLVAEDDIKCYKAVYSLYSDGWISPIANFTYKRDNVYISDVYSCDELDQKIELTEGVFHSYITFDKASAACDMLFWKMSDEYGFFPRTVVECIIPKGTAYWKNDIGCEYASMALKVIGEVYEV